MLTMIMLSFASLVLTSIPSLVLCLWAMPDRQMGIEEIERRRNIRSTYLPLLVGLALLSAAICVVLLVLVIQSIR